MDLETDRLLHTATWLAVLFWLASGVPSAAQTASPCDFSPAESRFTQLNVQGSGQWFDDPYRDDRNNSLTTTLNADYTHLTDTGTVGYRLEGNGQLGLTGGEFDAQLDATGNLKYYVRGDWFGIGALDARWSLSAPLRGDLSAGGGRGRFRDVTPLVKAIRLQNALLDLGALEGPLVDETLNALAKVISVQGTPTAERIERLERALEGSGLVAGDQLDARALLAIETVLSADEAARLCGWEVQLSAGAELRDVPQFGVGEAFVLSGDVAFVPNAISQWSLGARWVSGLDPLRRSTVRAEAAFGQRLRENLRVRGRYAFGRDRAPERADADRHLATLAAYLRVGAGLDVTLSGELNYETGDEQVSKTLAFQLSYDVF